MNIADRIQCLRKNKGLSQEELADKVGVSRQAVSKWESEQSTPDIEKIIIMSELFEVTTDYILKGIEPVSMTNKKTMYSLYLGFALIFATIAGIWSFTANRFRIDECFFIVIAGAAIGCAIALVIQVIFKICGHGTILALTFFAAFRNFHISICSQIVDKLRLTRYYKGNPNTLPRRCNHDRRNLRPLFIRQPARSVH